MAPVLDLFDHLRFDPAIFPARPPNFCGAPGLHAGGSLPAEIRIELSGGQQAADVVDALVTRPFEIFELQIGVLAGFVEFLGAEAQIPFRLEIRKGALDLAEIYSIAARVGAAIGGIFDAAARDGLANDFGHVADLIISVCDAHVEGLTMNQVPRSFEYGQERAADVFDVHHRSPRRTIALD